MVPPDRIRIMSNSAEEIEAKLAAYVDGELSGAEKAEIERHLASNPGHAALIKDLMQQRVLIRRLPREDAPLDLTDNLQQQLEREVLLAGDVADEASLVVGRINRMPQYLSIAAMLLLTAGVGTAVYLMLPSRHPHAELARNDGAAPLKKSEVDEAKRDDARNLELAKEKSVGNRMDSGKSDMLAQGAVVAERLRPEPEVNELQRRRSVVEAGKGNSADNNTVTLAVAADDLAGAKTTLVAYLVTNNMDWRPGDETLLNAAGVSDKQVDLARSANELAEGTLYQKPGAVDWQNALFGGGGGRGAGAAAGRSGGATEAIAPNAVVAKAAPTPMPEERNAAATTRPAAPTDPASAELVARNVAPSRGHVPPAPAPLVQGEADRALAGGAPATQPAIGARVVVVRNLNARQVEELAAIMTQPQRRQFAAVATKELKREAGQEQADLKDATLVKMPAPALADRAMEAVAPAATQPADKPQAAFGTPVHDGAPTTRPATRAADESTTRPALDPARDDPETLYNVVVVLRQNEAAASKQVESRVAEPTAPSTQPAKETAKDATPVK